MKKINFTQIPNGLVFEKKISDQAFRTLIAIESFNFSSKSKICPSQKTLAKLRGISIKSVSVHLQELKEKGLLSWRKRGYSLTNIYLTNIEEYFYSKSALYENSENSNLKKTSIQSERELQSNNTYNNTKRKIENLNEEEIRVGLSLILEKNPWLKSNAQKLYQAKDMKIINEKSK